MEYIFIVLSSWLFFAIACTFMAVLKEMDWRFWLGRGLIFGGFAFLFLLFSFDE